MRSAIATLAIAVCSAALLAQIPGRNVNMVAGTTLARRRSVPAAAERAVDCRVHAQPAAPARRRERLPHGRPAGAAEQHRNRRRLAGRLQVVRRRQHLAQHAAPGLPAGHRPAASPLRATAAGADPGRPRRHQRPVLLLRARVRPRRRRRKSAIFVSRFIDNNNQEKGDPIAFLGTKLVDDERRRPPSSTSRGWPSTFPGQRAACTITTTPGSPTVDDPDRVVTTAQRSPAGPPTSPSALIIGDGADAALADLSVTLDGLRRHLERAAADQLGQRSDQPGRHARHRSAQRHVYLAWRRFTADGTDDSIMVARSMDQGRKWDPPGRARRFPRGKKVGHDPEMHRQEVQEADLARGSRLARPADTRGPVPHQRLPDDDHRRRRPRLRRVVRARLRAAQSRIRYDGDARILMATSTNGSRLDARRSPVDNTALRPATRSCRRSDVRRRQADARVLRPPRDASQVFSQFIDEARLRSTASGTRSTSAPRWPRRATAPAFAPSVRVSDYLMGNRPSTRPRPVEQLQFNPPNLPMFKLGHGAVHRRLHRRRAGAGLRADRRRGLGVQHGAGQLAVFHAVWTDNRDVRPAGRRQLGQLHARPPSLSAGTSIFDGADARPGSALPGHAGCATRTSTRRGITGGLLAGSPGNSKPLHPTLPARLRRVRAEPDRRPRDLPPDDLAPAGRAAARRSSSSRCPPIRTPPPARRTSIDVIVPGARSMARARLRHRDRTRNAQIAVDGEGDRPRVGGATC